MCFGDSVTAGTPPTELDDQYRAVLSRGLMERFGADLVIDDCSRLGARTDDYLDDQIPECFPDVETRTTLVVATNGGNDLFAAAEAVLEGGSDADGLAVLSRAVDYHEQALQWFRDHPERFPGGVHIIMANVYEFTDTTGDLSACDYADPFGFGGQIDAAVTATEYLNAEWGRVAAETRTDMLFMNETLRARLCERRREGPLPRPRGRAVVRPHLHPPKHRRTCSHRPDVPRGGGWLNVRDRAPGRCGGARRRGEG